MPNRSIAQTLIQNLKASDAVLAIWEGGSAANKRSDAFSDLDLVVVAEHGRVEEVFRTAEKTLAALRPLRHVWRVPTPTWHGHEQCFYKLDDADPYFFIDLVVMTPDAKQKFLEPERHGTPVMHLDRIGFIDQGTATADTEEFRERRRARRRALADAFPFYLMLVRKEIQRGRAIDAMAFYRHLQNTLIELLGMKYRPLRYDFGLRYTENDFPPDETALLRRLLYPADLAAIGQDLPLLEAQVETLLAELQNDVD